MDRNNLKLKTISLNVRGIRTFEKRKSIFNWLIKQNSDICFLQETYSTEETENLCYFCEDEPETLEHFFFYCSKVRVFWEEVNLSLNSQGMMYRSFNIRDILFGVLDIVSNEILLNYIVLESKHFIYRTKLSKTSLSLTLLIEKIRKTFQIERHIAKKNNKLQLHYNKWNPLLHLVEQ